MQPEDRLALVARAAGPQAMGAYGSSARLEYPASHGPETETAPAFLHCRTEDRIPPRLARAGLPKNALRGPLRLQLVGGPWKVIAVQAIHPVSRNTRNSLAAGP